MNAQVIQRLSVLVSSLLLELLHYNNEYYYSFNRGYTDTRTTGNILFK